MPQGPPAKYTYSALNDPSVEIRVLELQPGVEPDPIHCSLIPVHLGSEGITYEAVSYTWGAEEASCSIRIGNPTFPVRPNLMAALKRLRKPDSARRLWVDAVCINQDDIPERHAQVRMMLPIFQTATRVVVWLGEVTDDSHVAMHPFGFMHNFHAFTFELWEAALSPSSQWWQAFAKLIGWPWWRRTWVIREVVAAEAVLVLCGPEGLPWERLAFNLAQLTVTMHHLGGKAPLRLDADTSDIAAFRQQYQSDQWQRRGLLKTLSKFRSWQATDARDKVYGLLGLAAADAGGDRSGL
ncbi:heterokaryon incompatibility protein-domain-containing protein [Achaetomium macrosporum]|uniref:Heterokaryon incompatibility protein-domain-containing protein n=1 Tax=Achaetomium macrosporum TaxID=79813 RepID=A0AAN7HEV7_9PEZI|nr:heterokaryon incompatibility protein-domain-containing protein [Achaetomium macrosporum]